MSKWEYQREERPTSGRLQPGDYRVIIESAYDGEWQDGTEYIEINLAFSGSNMKLRHRISRNEYFDRNMSSFFDSFTGIADGDFNFLAWTGAEGAAKLKLKDEYLRVWYFLTPEQAKNLPEWEGVRPERQQAGEMPKNDDDEELPF